MNTPRNETTTQSDLDVRPGESLADASYRRAWPVGVKYNQDSDNPEEWTYEATCDEHGPLHIGNDEDVAYGAAQVHLTFAHRS